MSVDGREGAGQPRVAVLGVGTMGAGMVRNLVRSGLSVDVWNRTPGPAAALAEDGAHVHADPALAVGSADVVITMLGDGTAVRSVMLGQGALAAMKAGAIWAQMGTIGVGPTDEMIAAVAAQRPDVTFVDAPVSGTRQPAEAGQLLVLAGGPESARVPLEPVFGAVGQATRWLGEAGAGTRFKLITNAWLFFLIEGAAEIMALADSLGVSREAVLGLLGQGRMASPVAAGKAAKMDSGDDSPDFSMQWAVKDVGLAIDAAPGRALTALEAIRDRWQSLVDQGMGELDTSAARHGFERTGGAASLRMAGAPGG